MSLYTFKWKLYLNDEKKLYTHHFSMIFCEGWKPSVLFCYFWHPLSHPDNFLKDLSKKNQKTFQLNFEMMES